MEHANVGVVGLGRIGSGLIANLLNAGRTVYGLDLDKKKMEKAAAIGLKSVESASEMARLCPIILLSLFDADSVEQLLFSSSGIAGIENQELSVVIDTTTIPPEKSREFARRLSESGIAYLDAPITGGEHGARQGKLTFMVGGEPEIYRQAVPYFEILGSQHNLVGPAGAGSVAKMVNQMLMVAYFSGAAESAAYARLHDIDFNTILDSINAELSNNAYVKMFAERLDQQLSEGEPISRHYESLFLKDMKCALASGHRLPVTEGAASILKGSIEDKSKYSFPVTMMSALLAMQNKE